MAVEIITRIYMSWYDLEAIKPRHERRHVLYIPTAAMLNTMAIHFNEQLARNGGGLGKVMRILPQSHQVLAIDMILKKGVTAERAAEAIKGQAISCDAYDIDFCLLGRDDHEYFNSKDRPETVLMFDWHAWVPLDVEESEHEITEEDDNDVPDEEVEIDYLDSAAQSYLLPHLYAINCQLIGSRIVSIMVEGKQVRIEVVTRPGANEKVAINTMISKLTNSNECYARYMHSTRDHTGTDGEARICLSLPQNSPYKH